MDPDAALKKLNNAIRDRDDDDFLEAYEDLMEWLGRGGFPPKGAARAHAALDFHPDEVMRLNHAIRDAKFGRKKNPSVDPKRLARLLNPWGTK